MCANEMMEDWIFDSSAIRKLLQELSFRADITHYICQVAERLSSFDKRAAFLEFCRHLPEDSRHKEGSDIPDEWKPLATVYWFPATIAKHQKRGIPSKITRDTLHGISPWFDDYRIKNGAFGFSNIAWMRHHLFHDLFKIGRLEYIPGPFGYKFIVYENAQTGAPIALTLPGLHCTNDGWITSKQGDFKTELTKTTTAIIGHAAREDGSVIKTPVQISASSKVLLDSSHTVANIHIPAGEKLTRESCVQSLHEAKAFYQKYFSQLNIAGFCTGTWLLDAEFRKILPPHSNIIQFGRLFHLLSTTDANDHQLRERVFNNAEWQDCTTTNSLQRTVLEHHNNGGQFRVTAGYILPTNAVYSSEARGDYLG